MRPRSSTAGTLPEVATPDRREGGPIREQPANVQRSGAHYGGIKHQFTARGARYLALDRSCWRRVRPGRGGAAPAPLITGAAS